MWFCNENYVCYVVIFALYTENHIKQRPLRVRFSQIAWSQLFLADYCANGTISTEYDNACIFTTLIYFLAHTCTCTCKLHVWIYIICLCVTRVRHVCDLHGPFNLWVICIAVNMSTNIATLFVLLFSICKCCKAIIILPNTSFDNSKLV